MHLLIASREDPASMSIASAVLDAYSFQENGGKPGILKYKNYLFSYIDIKHLFLDNFGDLFGAIMEDIEDVIFLSKHSSKADIKSLTVHPTGNYSEALLGGREKKLSMSDPSKMSSTLRMMNEIYSGDIFSVTYEATHHGPLMENIPNFFIEIGTTREQWEDREALQTVVEALLSENKSGGGAFVGAGGGHYMPKITRYSIENSVDMGHMISKHALEHLNEAMIAQSVEKTPGCKGFILDRKGVKSNAKQQIKDFADISGLEVILV